MTKALDRAWTIIQNDNLKTSFLTPLFEFISGGRYADQSSRFRIVAFGTHQCGQTACCDVVSPVHGCGAAGYKQPVSSLEAYEKGLEAAVAQIDDGREPYLVMREALTAGMWPFIEVWDVGIARVTVGTGKRIGASRTRELVQVSTKGGDLMLPPDTLLVWR